MRLKIISESDGQPVEGVAVFLSKPFKRLPAASRLTGLPQKHQGESDQQGHVELSGSDLSGPVQLTIVSSGSGRRRILASRQFAGASNLPSSLEVKIATSGRAISGENIARPISDNRDGPAVIAAAKGSSKDNAKGAADLPGKALRPRPTDTPTFSGDEMGEIALPERNRGSRDFAVPPLGGFAARNNDVSANTGASLREGLAGAMRRDAITDGLGRVFADNLLSRPPGPMRRGDTLLKSRLDLSSMLKNQQNKGIAAMKKSAPRARGLLLRGTATNAVKGGEQVRLAQLMRALPGLSLAGRISRRSVPSQLVRAP